MYYYISINIISNLYQQLLIKNTKHGNSTFKQEADQTDNTSKVRV